MLLYHYCSNDTFLSILRNSELWLSELTLSNDSMEGIWVREVLLEECRERNLSPHALDDFAKKTTFLLEIFSAAGFCLSAKGDLLSQWRGYAENGAGVAIGFDPKTIEELCEATKEKGMEASLGRVVYKSPEQRSAIQPYVDQLINYTEKDIFSDKSRIAKILDTYKRGYEKTIDKNTFLYFFQFRNMSNLFFRLKNPAFREEEEWRILSSIDKMKFDGNYSKSGCYNDTKNLDFRARGDHIVPYLRLPIPDDKKSCVREVILGPRNRTPKPVIRAVLEKYGFHNVDIEPSTATYR